MGDETEKQTFGKWLQTYYVNKFIPWYLGKHGKIPSQNEFAKWLGIRNTNLSQYMNDNRRPDVSQSDLLATRLGPEVYDRLDLPRKMPKDKALYWIADHWHELTEDEQKSILADAKQSLERRKGDEKPKNAYA